MATRGGFTKNEGDWNCPDPKCGNTNFARRDKCNRCGSEKAQTPSGKVKLGGFELGKQLAEKSKGLFSADDWQCKSCGNVNWARRGTCNVCNTPKVGQVEERTGFGGGFMERDENPDKIVRNSDDEEYDEFGRKKKKYRGPTEEVKPTAGRDDEEEEEDDDEEDSDDDDLGKYAFDSDDAEEAKKESTKSENRPSSGTSRSSSNASYSRDGSDKKRESSSRSRSSSDSDSDDSRDRRHSRSRSPIRR